MAELGGLQDNQMPAPSTERYRIEATLGAGGMATVYAARDIVTQRRVALKRLTPVLRETTRKHATRLFEQEFHTLAQLAHPRVVEVYDYVKEQDAAFYTMELLDGGDLRDLTPVPWRRMCALLCDICSALSLLHSRRLVHRDLTPRNVRCTQDGKAKVIDFGALIRVGPCRRIIGTPSFIAPEALTSQVVDARTDLFALGATAYHALTGRHAYPAKTLAAVRDAWRSRPPPPSYYAKDIPPELDELILSMLQLLPVARPASAAEIMERSSAIAGISLDEQLLVHEAYLRTPSLAGRDEALMKVRKQMMRAVRGRGGAIVVTGGRGVGRSRFLDACVLEGKLVGAGILRIDASDSGGGNWGAAQALARQLLNELPHIAAETAKRHATVLVHILPDLPEQLRSSASDLDVGVGEEAADVVPQQFSSPQELRSSVLEAFRRWLLEVSERNCLVVAADDWQALDEPSAALVALLAHESRRKRLAVVATAETESSTPSDEALSMLADVSAAIKLRPLEIEQTEELLRSIFGDVPNVRLLADRLYALSGGHPRSIMQLAQHLLDRGIVRYGAGVWTLPSRLDPGDLPATVEDALKARLDPLREPALELAQMLALTSRKGLSFEECLALSSHRDTGNLVRELRELTAAEVLTSDGDWYSLGHPSWRPILTSRLDTSRARALHLRLAEGLEIEPTDAFRAAHHLLQAGERERALDLMLGYMQLAGERRAQGLEQYFEFIQSLPSDWLSSAEAVFRLCKELGRPKVERFTLQYGLLSFASVTAKAPIGHLQEITQELFRAAGLDIYAEIGDAVEPPIRLGQALGKARERYDALPPSERMLSPFEAIQQLAQTTIRAIGLAGRALDRELLSSMPSLEPFSALSPAVAVIEENRRSTLNVLSGRSDQAREGYLRIVERMDQPDGAGLQGSDHTNMRCAVIWALGIVEIQGGLPDGVKWADAIEQSPLFEVNAWRLRLLHALRQGDAENAERCKQQLELLRIQNRPPQLFEGSYLGTLALAFATCDDLAGVKELLPGIEAMAEELPHWRACLHYARGLYQFLRGNHERALAEFEEALRRAAPGRHLMWAPIAGWYVSALLSTRGGVEAKRIGDRLLAEATRERIATMSIYIRQPLALVEASLGNHEFALGHIAWILDNLEAKGATGVALGAIYETRARLAIAMKDRENFEAFAERCAVHYRVGIHPTLTAKFERLMHDARRAALTTSTGPVAIFVASPPEPSDFTTKLATLLGTCRGREERAQRALDVLLEHSGAAAGFLYTIQDGGPVLAAHRGDSDLAEEIDGAVAEYIAREMQSAEEVTQTAVEIARSTQFGATLLGGGPCTPMLLHHEATNRHVVTGVAVLIGVESESPNALLPVVNAVSKSLFDAGDVATIDFSL